LAGAGLLIRSMERVQKINPGFETQKLFAFNFDVGSQRYSAERGRQFFRTAIEKASAAPGVHSAAVSSNQPLGGGILATLIAEGQESNPDQRGTLTMLNMVSPGYFETMRIPLVEGRLFTDFDREGTRRVAVITEAMARHFWPGQSATGKRFRLVVE